MATATRTRTKKFTPEQREAYRAQKRTESAELLASAVNEMLSSEGWQRWVAFRSRVHRYSFNNTMLIALQLPEATIVQSYKKWKEAGRSVTAGQHALKVFAPLFRKPTAEDIAAGHPADRDVLFGFKLVPTFDVSQTEGEPVPMPTVEPLTGDTHVGYLNKLETLAVSAGYSVLHEDLSDTGIGGYCDPILHRIVVNSAGSANEQVHTLIHEIAHALGVGYKEYGREDAEVIVETVTHIVCAGIGLEVTEAAAPYIAGWGEQDKAAAMTKFAGLVDALARKIEKAIAA